MQYLNDLFLGGVDEKGENGLEKMNLSVELTSCYSHEFKQCLTIFSEKKSGNLRVLENKHCLKNQMISEEILCISKSFTLSFAKTK